MYTVTEVSEISGVTVKALHHYHKIGLLEPSQIGDNNYRYYGEDEIDRLQHILFYRALDFSLEDIKLLINEETNRLILLRKQESLLSEKKEEMNQMLKTIRESIEIEEQKMNNVDNTNCNSTADKGKQIVDNSKKFEGLNDVDPIDSTLKNMVIISSKPNHIYMLFIGIGLIISFSLLLSGVGTVTAEKSDFLFYVLPAEMQPLTVIIFIILGVVTVILCIRVIFFTKTKDLLEIANKPYLNRSKREDNKKNNNS